MTPTIDKTDKQERSEQIIADLLWYGTWLASALIAAGLLLTAVSPQTGQDIIKAGVAVFILLPVARVALMLALFLRERDYIYSLIAALVLAIIAAGILIEIRPHGLRSMGSLPSGSPITISSQPTKREAA